jgi:hypothetical protein
VTSALALTGTVGVHAQPSTVDEAPFLTENDAAMDKMMADMAVKAASSRADADNPGRLECASARSPDPFLI